MFATKKNSLILLFPLLLISAPQLLAHDRIPKVYEGCYIPVRGYVETQSINPLEQLGEIRIILVRENWYALPDEDRKRIRRGMVVNGVLKGTFDPATNTASHVISDKGREGLFFTEGDYLIPTSFDCFVDGVPLLLSGRETVNLASGSGKYGNFQSGVIYLDGTVNNCPSDPGFGKNDFQVVPNEGAVCFSAP